MSLTSLSFLQVTYFACLRRTTGCGRSDRTCSRTTACLRWWTLGRPPSSCVQRMSPCTVFRGSIMADTCLSHSPEKKHEGTDGLAAFVAMW